VTVVNQSHIQINLKKVALLGTAYFYANKGSHSRFFMAFAPKRIVSEFSV
jgi:hypothetical protein